MYLSELRLWNFRKFGDDSNIDLTSPHLIVPFKNKLNILVGENDSGKTAIIDAIKLVIKTHAIEWIKLEDSDFHNTTDNLRIELRFDGFNDLEASWFTEWLSWDNTTKRPFLRVIYKARKINDRIIQGDVTAGATDDGRQMTSIARDYLKCTYLKALRDADSELSARKNSRVSQILQGHDLFAKIPGQDHDLEQFVQEANEKIDSWFNDSTQDVDEHGDPIEGTSHREQLKDKIDSYLKEFIDFNLESELKISDPKVKTILDAISVRVKQNSNKLGLGTMNRLYMATELLHLNNGKPGLHLGLIEELEAHLHPQAQMKVMSSLQSRDVQFIMSTHSPNLTSKVRLADKDNVNFIMCHGTDVYPLNPDTTRLKEPDFSFLDTFLDVTKSNLFYAKGVILVEGWAEELLIPTLAKKLDMDLTTNEVSVVNVGSTAYLRYANIFVRTDGKILDVPVSVVTDLDVAPQLLSHDEQEEEDGTVVDYSAISEKDEKEKECKIKESADFPADQKVNMYIAPHWTLEWSLYLSTALKTLFMESVSNVHSKTAAFKRNEDLSWDEDGFKNKLIEKLKYRTLDKVAIAQTLVAKINKTDQITIEDDDSAYYLVAAIKHACRR